MWKKLEKNPRKNRKNRDFRQTYHITFRIQIMNLAFLIEAEVTLPTQVRMKAALKSGPWIYALHNLFNSTVGRIENGSLKSYQISYSK